MQLKEAINEAGNSIKLKTLSKEEHLRLQNTLLEMYIDLLSVCEKYQITPYLGGGSALGAVRHKGFIPWDDDFDINITRRDYERLKKIFEHELSEKYILIAPNYKGKSITRFPKILKRGTRIVEAKGPKDKDLQCIYIDVFIIENAPTNRLHRMIKGTICNTLEFIAGRVDLYLNSDELTILLLKKSDKKYYLNRFIGAVFSPFSLEFWNNLVDRAVQYSKDTKLCCFPTGRKHYFGEILEKEKLFPVVYLPFETIQAPVFRGYDYYLTNLYGNYMEIPPVEKREQHFIRELEL